MNKLPGNDLSV